MSVGSRGSEGEVVDSSCACGADIIDMADVVCDVVAVSVCHIGGVAAALGEADSTIDGMIAVKLYGGSLSTLKTIGRGRL